MSNPYRAPKQARDASTPSMRNVAVSVPFVLSFPYTLLARELAGPAYTNAPNQGAMALFFAMWIGWIVISCVAVFVLHFLSRAQWAYSVIICLASCAVPYLIGMK